MMKISLSSFCAVFATLVLAPLGQAQSYTFTTIAGRPPLPGNVDGPAADARFTEAFATATDASGNVYVADPTLNVIRKIAPDGVVSTFAGRAGEKGTVDGSGSNARFNAPTGLATDSAGNVYVSDYDNGTVRKITPAGTVSTLAGLPLVYGSTDGTGSGARFNAPSALVVDPSGNVYVTDWSNRNIRKITPAGTVTTIAGLVGVTGTTDGVGTAARFAGPGGIALDADGNLFVCDSPNHSIRKITPAGSVTTYAGLSGTSGTTNATGTAARFNRPLGIVADGDGNVFVADSSNNSIRKIAPGGVVTTFAGANGLRGSANGTASLSRYFRPTGISLDRSGNFFVADNNNYTIRKISAAGIVTDYAGPGGTFGSTDGVGPVARFNLPGGLALDGSGSLLVADSSNYTVRKVSTAGSVTTFAGVAGTLFYNDGPLAGARMGYPSSVTVDTAGNIYVSDAIYHAIRLITPEGNVFTYAGQPLTSGSANGVGTAAQFNAPDGLATDREGNLYVADASNHVIRKISPTRVVTTLAGLAGTSGTADGSGTTARFNGPHGVTVDGSGNVFVADTANHAIRKIAPDGTVTTFAGLPGFSGSADGNSSSARFLSPYDLTVDTAGNIFVADTDNHTVRKITPAGVVTTIGGLAGAFSSVDATGTAARFSSPTGIVVDPSGVLYILDGGANTLIRGELDRVPTFAIQPQTLTVSSGSTVVLSPTAIGGGLSYQWKLNGVAVAGATSPTLTLSNAQSAVAGTYTLEASNSAGMIASQPATLSISSTADFGRIINLAIRAQAGSGAQTLIVGIAVGGSGASGTKPILVRGVGPTLANFNVPGVLNDPLLSVFQGSTVVNSNDNWEGNAQVAAISGQVGAFALGSATSKDAAIYNAGFGINTYTVQITGAGGTSGVALAEIYDASPASTFSPSTPRLVNVSARTQVGTGGNILIAGFVIGGSTAKTVLIRATGPALDLFGVLGVLADPKLDVIRSDSSTVVASNDNWGGGTALANTFSSVGAFSLAPTSKDAAVVVTLPPGAYTAQVAGVGETTGVALIEVYEVP